MSGDEGIAKSSEAESGPPGISVPEATSRSVFLSYASHDAGAANTVCQYLESHAVSCWMAPRDVKPGTQYADAIVRAISESKALVLVLSGNAVASDHVAREVERAASKHKPIIAFRIDSVPLNPGLEYFLSNSQWIDVPALGMPAALKNLAEAVGQGSTQAKAAASLGAAVKPVAKTRHLAIAAAILVGVGAAVALAVHFWPYHHGGTQEQGSAAISDKSIAVLPFVDMSEKKDQEYFADGMADEILDLLAKIPGLKVIGRTSSFQFKGRNEDLRAIGEKLGAAYVLEGSVRRSGNQMRVTAQLISTVDGAHRWSDTYDSRFDDVLKVQDAIASNLARALEVAVGTLATSDRRADSPQAYDLFLQGMQALDTNTKEGCERAIGLFSQVLQLDPMSARALVALARTYEDLGEQGWMLPKEAFEKARYFALRALQVDPKSGGAHAVLAYVHLIFDWDWAAAEKEIDFAFTYGERSAWALDVAAQIATTLGQWSHAEQFVREALAQDPLDPTAHTLLGYWIFARQGRDAEAEAPLRRVLQLSPNYGSGRYFLAICLLMQGRLQEALDEAQAEQPQDGKYQVSSEVLFAMHRKAESDDALKKAIKQSEGDWPVSIAKVYAFRGERDQALNWLDRAYQFHDEDLYFIKGDPQLRSLDSDPRYKAFLRKMNLPE